MRPAPHPFPSKARGPPPPGAPLAPEDHPLALGVDAEVLPPDLTGQVEGFTRLAEAGDVARVPRHALLECPQDIGGRPEEPVRGDHSPHAAVRALEVVVARKA